MTRDEIYDLTGSTQIATECEACGVEPRYIGEAGMGNFRITLWEVDGERVFSTNGDCVWEDADPEGFAALLEQLPQWQVEVRSTTGEWVRHSVWATQEEAEDQADYVHGRVVQCEEAAE